MKKLLVMMLTVLGICVGSFAKESSNESDKQIYKNLFFVADNQCRLLGKPAYLECWSYLTKYEEYFLKLRNLDTDYGNIFSLNKNDLAFVVNRYVIFVYKQVETYKSDVEDFTQDELNLIEKVKEKLDICKLPENQEQGDKSILGCK
jgi:hypothetical protein